MMGTDIHDPVFVAGSAIMWVAATAMILVPGLRTMSRQSSIFFMSGTPVGRASARVATVRTFFLWAVLSAVLAMNLPIPTDVAKSLMVGFGGLALLTLLLAFGIILLNRPRFLVPKTMREQPGAIQEWFEQISDAIRGRRPGRSSHARRSRTAAGSPSITTSSSGTEFRPVVDNGKPGVLTFYRGREWEGFLSTYQLYVDDRLVGWLKRSSEFSLELPAGTYSCRVGVSFTGSPTVAAPVSSGQTTRLHVLPNRVGDLMENALAEDGSLLIEVE